MFQALRPNNQVYILHKDKVILETGSVVNVSAPTPKYSVQPPMYGQPQEMLVDIVIKINNKDITYSKIPANLDITDCNNGTIVLSADRNAMNAEVVSLKQKSTAILDSIEYHKEVISNCDNILSTLNPEFAEKQQQQQEINSLKDKMEDMSKNISELMALNKKLMTQLKKE